ncbi:MAG: hypothetical protein JKY48_13775 [Flavobacteriales bacterium]|nr:hypothetical protein [Flavobacteriales bacterium]
MLGVRQFLKATRFDGSNWTTFFSFPSALGVGLALAVFTAFLGIVFLATPFFCSEAGDTGYVEHLFPE